MQLEIKNIGVKRGIPERQLCSYSPGRVQAGKPEPPVSSKLFSFHKNLLRLETCKLRLLARTLEDQVMLQPMPPLFFPKVLIKEIKGFAIFSSVHLMHAEAR